MASNSTNIHKLQQAINNRGGQILYNTTQFYSVKQNRPVNIYIIKQAYYDVARDRVGAVELFKSTSQIQILLFLRDMWFEMNGWEVPTDNEQWNAAKEEYYKRRNRSSSQDTTDT